MNAVLGDVCVHRVRPPVPKFLHVFDPDASLDAGLGTAVPDAVEYAHMRVGVPLGCRNVVPCEEVPTYLV